MTEPLKVKVIGAGSIGNHLTQAARRMGWDITVVDRDPEALCRMKEEIYPKRYGAWDESIKLVTSEHEPKGGFDIICIGTPPDVRLKLALEALKEKPKILQLEKPLCEPLSQNRRAFVQKYREQKDTVAIMGYDHAVSPAAGYVAEFLRKEALGEVLTLDVEFREHWGGIFAAHPWLTGPKDTYLGYWNRGGGAGCEHSHALHLWNFLREASGIGKSDRMDCFMDFKNDGGAEYDTVASFSFLTDKGKISRVIQDVVTAPTRKWVRVQGANGFIEWIINGDPAGDVVRVVAGNGPLSSRIFAKKRMDDFYEEMLHIKDIIDGKVDPKKSPISFESGCAVMEILDSAYLTNRIYDFLVKR